MSMKQLWRPPSPPSRSPPERRCRHGRKPDRRAVEGRRPRLSMRTRGTRRGRRDRTGAGKPGTGSKRSGWPTVAPPLRRAWSAALPILAQRRLWTTPRTAGGRRMPSGIKAGRGKARGRDGGRTGPVEPHEEPASRAPIAAEPTKDPRPPRRPPPAAGSRAGRLPPSTTDRSDPRTAEPKRPRSNDPSCPPARTTARPAPRNAGPSPGTTPRSPSSNA